MSTAPKKYEVYWLTIEFDGDIKPRPWVVLEDATTDTVLMATISTKMDLMNRREDLELPDSDPEFQSSSLKSTSHVIRDSVADIPRRFVEGKRRGLLAAEQRRKLDAWIFFWETK